MTPNPNNFTYKGFIKGDLKRQTYFHSNGPHEDISGQSSLSKRAYNTIKTDPFEDALQEGFFKHTSRRNKMLKKIVMVCMFCVGMTMNQGDVYAAAVVDVPYNDTLRNFSACSIMGFMKDITDVCGTSVLSSHFASYLPALTHGDVIRLRPKWGFSTTMSESIESAFMIHPHDAHLNRWLTRLANCNNEDISHQAKHINMVLGELLYETNDPDPKKWSDIIRKLLALQAKLLD